jgi:hypothetical protein
MVWGLISERSYPWDVEPAGLNGSIRERVVCCWILATYADAMYAQGMPGRPWAADECLESRQDRTQRRLTNACKALAQIRKLLRRGRRGRGRNMKLLMRGDIISFGRATGIMQIVDGKIGGLGRGSTSVVIVSWTKVIMGERDGRDVPRRTILCSGTPDRTAPHTVAQTLNTHI